MKWSRISCTCILYLLSRHIMVDSDKVQAEPSEMEQPDFDTIQIIYSSVARIDLFKAYNRQRRIWRLLCDLIVSMYCTVLLTGYRKQHIHRIRRKRKRNRKGMKIENTPHVHVSCSGNLE